MRLLASCAAALRRGADRWLFRVGAPETAPIRLTQRRIYVLPTAAGLGFAGALVVMLVTSINYNLSLGHALVFLLGGAATASIVHAFRNLLGLSVRPGRCEPVFAGEAAGFRLLIDNPRPARRPALRLRARGQTSAFELGTAAESAVLLACPTTHRGRLSMGRTVIETTWPLGLIRAWSVFVPEAECIVHPSPEIDPPALPADGSAGAGTGGSVREGDDDFAGLRTHRIADSPRHVAWKALARGGPMLTKQYAATRGGDVVLDWSALPARLDDEQRLSRLSAWILRAEQDGRRYGLLLPQTRIAPGLGRDHRDRCLRELALFGIEPPDRGRRT